LARTAYSVVRGLNRGAMSKLPLGLPNITGNHQDGLLGNFVKTFPEECISIEERMPDHYMHFYNQWKLGPSPTIHQRPTSGNFKKDHTGKILPVQSPTIPVLYPKEFHQGLWGGEGVVKGLLEPEVPKHKPSWDSPKERYWMPKLYIGVVYSEVLNAHIEVAMTKRARRLIDQAYGLDYYLLKTPVNEIYSHLGLKMKREILLKLSGAGRNPDVDKSSSRFEKVLSKYQDFVVPHEVADWHGLPWLDAVDKLLEHERIGDQEGTRPLRERYRKDLLDQLSKGHFDDVDLDLLGEDNAADPSFINSLGNTFRNLKDKMQPK